MLAKKNAPLPQQGVASLDIVPLKKFEPLTEAAYQLLSPQEREDYLKRLDEDVKEKLAENERERKKRESERPPVRVRR